ncbi:MAG: hypothetical protein [Siphoviridae sp. ct7UA22]|nr:MAG: hypothetical protein [Siphoviridae sp. ct7UA22]
MPLLLLKGLGVFFVRKMLLGLALDLVQDSLDAGAKKTDVKWDDNLAQSFRENRAELEQVIKGVL